MKLKNINLLNLALSFFIGIGGLSLAKAEEATAGLFVEPAITYELGDGSVNYPSPLSNSSGTVKGFGLGARLGFHLNEAFFVGLDARYAMPYFKDSSVNYSANSVATNWGPVIGMQMPNIGMRLWASYILGGEMNPEKSGSFDVKFLNATGYRIGAGFRIASLSLNIEYQQLKYGTSRLEQIGPFTGGTQFDNVNLNNNAWLASVSFPLAL